jgi:hypothetical protein
MAGEHAELLAVTTAKYIKGKSDETTRKLPELAFLRDKGNVKYNQSGTAIVWVVKYKWRDLETHEDMAEVTYTRKEVHKQATLTYKAEYTMQDAISWGDEKKNRGKEALVVLAKDKLDDMNRDSKNQFVSEMYIDGSDTGNERKLDGIDTIFQQSGTDDGDEYMVNNGTYAGITTTKGAYGGSSAADPQYDFFSAVGVNCVYDPGSAISWASNADEILSKAILSVLYGNTNEDMLDLFTLTKSSYLAFLELMREKERYMADNTNLKRLGFGAGKNIAVNHDGVDVTWTAGVPTEDSEGKTVHGYGWNFDFAELCWLGSDLFEGMSDYDKDQHAYRFSLIGGGNLKFKSPRHFVKLAEWPD